MPEQGSFQRRQSNSSGGGTLLLLLLAFAVVLFQAVVIVHGAPNRIDFRIENSKPRGNVLGLTFKNRFTLPYGPDLYNNQGYQMAQTSNDQPYRGYGVGMGAAEQIVFDPIQKYLYSMSDVGYVIIVDYEDIMNPQLTNLSFETEDDKLGSIEICPEQNMFFLTLEKLGRVDIYNLVNRTNPELPTLLKSVDAGSNVKSILPNKDCTLLAIANTNEGEDLAQGSITILENFMMDNDNNGGSASTTTTATTSGTDSGDGEGEVAEDEEDGSTRRIFNSVTIPLDYNEWDDEYLLRRGLNMPLSLKALEYWDDHSDDADDLDFSHVRKNYKSAIFLEPERLAWNGPDETELLVNLQENNGLLRINMTDFRPVAVAGYGLKDHSVVPIDIKEDGECTLKTYGSLFSMRNPDTIQSLRYNGKYYVFTANEGGGKGYGDWEEELKSNKLFKGSELALKKMITPKFLFDANANRTFGDFTDSAVFNSECIGTIMNDAECIEKIEISVGSNSIDYESDPANPIFYRMVLFGGRGWSIFELPEDPDDLLKLVFDSADAFEKDGCAKYPWSHNGKQDEEFSPISGPNSTLFLHLDPEDREDMIEKNDPEEDGCLDQGDGTPGACPLSKTVDAESDKDGSAIENIFVGEACGRLVTAMASEKASIAMLFDVTDITSPDLIQVFHLSESSQYKSIGLAYNAGELGEVDPESGVFLNAEQSPSGKAGILFAGAYSGTISWWEFDCKEE